MIRPAPSRSSIVRATGDTVPSELPFRGKRRVDDRRPCGYFLGGAVAIRRDSFAAAGGYDERYEYSTEEIDLAFALQREGELIDLLIPPSSSNIDLPSWAAPLIRMSLPSAYATGCCWY